MAALLLYLLMEKELSFYKYCFSICKNLCKRNLKNKCESKYRLALTIFNLIITHVIIIVCLNTTINSNKLIHTNLNSSAGASEALLLYIDDILRSLTGRSCQSGSSGSVLRRLDAPASSPRIPDARFVPRNDILTNMFTTYMFTNPSRLYTLNVVATSCRMSHYSHDDILICNPIIGKTCNKRN